MNPHNDMDEMADFAHSRLYTMAGPKSLPKGCDYQGRHPEAAEACTEIGADDDQSQSADAQVAPWLLLVAVLFVLLCWHIASWLL